MARNRVPNIVKHCAMAIYKKGGIEGSTAKGRFRSAWNIARARLVEYGFLIEGSQIGPAGRILLTSKGRQRNLEHRMERDGRTKSAEFDKRYAILLKDEQEGRTGHET